MLDFLKDLWDFMRVRKKFWLAPIIIVLLLLGLLIVLAEGSAVIATGLTGAPELNGQKGSVEGWLEEKGRYAVWMEDKKRKKAANLRPENCRADVLAL